MKNNILTSTFLFILGLFMGHYLWQTQPSSTTQFTPPTTVLLLPPAKTTEDSFQKDSLNQNLDLTKMQCYLNLVELYLNDPKFPVEIKDGVILNPINDSTKGLSDEWLDLRSTYFVTQMWQAKQKLSSVEYWHISNIHKQNPYALKVGTATLTAIQDCGDKGVKELTPSEMEIDYQASYQSSQEDRDAISSMLQAFLNKHDAVVSFTN